jgi:long-chain acyl-CoA synthetase
MLVTQGKTLFPEELEAVLTACPGVAHASVHGMPDPIRGQQVVAVVHLHAAQSAVTAQQLSAACRAQLESYKVPKRFFVWAHDWPRTASGKTDHPAVAKAVAWLPPLL